MSLFRKLIFIANNPRIFIDFPRINKKLKENKKKGKSNWVFQCDFKGHFSYLKPFYTLIKDNPKIDVFFSLNALENDKSPVDFLIEQGISPQKIIKPADYVALLDFDVYMSPTEWGNIFPKNHNALRTQVFHTLADKGILYGKELLKFNTIFMNGPIHHEFMEKYVFGPYPEGREYCKKYNTGFAKIDDLFDGTYSSQTLKQKLGIKENDKRKIILYAPNWELESALHTYGKSTFEELKNRDNIVLIKLHYMSLLSPDNFKATGGVDWNEVLNKYREFENIRIIDDASINPYLFLADLMVTDYGGASLEFMVMDKPIVYLDCPKFFAGRDQNVFEKRARETGFIIDNIKILNDTIDKAFTEDKIYLAKRAEMIGKLIYNRGKAAETGIKILKDLLAKNGAQF